jgi:archaellum component FlaC
MPEAKPKNAQKKYETKRNTFIDDIIKNRKDDLASMYKEFEGTTKLKGFERRVIEEYLEKIEGINKKDKKLKALYEKHKEEIIYIIYNCKEFMESIKDQLSELVDTIEV